MLAKEMAKSGVRLNIASEASPTKLRKMCLSNETKNSGDFLSP